MSYPTPGGGFEIKRVERARWTESPLKLTPDRAGPDIEREEVYDRQELLIGRAGQRILAASKVAVVGLGGGGSHVVQQLAHIGVGTIVLVDDDSVEASNLSRLVGAGPADLNRPKTAVMKQLVQGVNPDVRVEAFGERFPSTNGIRALRDSDVIVSCVDTLASRVELQKVSWRYVVPLIDIGMGTRISDGEGPHRATAVAGHIHRYLPGGHCMWCSGMLSPEKLAIESAGRGPEYVKGAVNPAQVVSFNGALASFAVVELMQLLTGFMARSTSRPLLSIDFLESRLYSVQPRSDRRCPHDSGELARGDPVGFAASATLVTGM
ncbi:MAG: ThiF family adenylyltransferase [Thermoplasmata archaeon]|nr:ThiF family adenylyltransferase [Thermoplasmata archaeon]